MQNECLQEQLRYYHLRQWNQEDEEAAPAVGTKPFSAAVREVTVPDGMVSLALEAYDGQTDPKNHLSRFSVKMANYVVSDAVKYRMLPLTFRGAAKEWFTNLPPGSIAKFRDFSSKFLDHFSARTIEDLFGIRQEERETLKQYVKRYSAISARFEELQPRACVFAFKGGLSRREFYCELSRELPCSMTEVRARAQDYILKEEIEAHKRKGERAAKVSLARKKVQDKEASREQGFKEAGRFIKKNKGKLPRPRMGDRKHWCSRREAKASQRRRSQGCSNKELAKLLLEAEIEDMDRVGKRRKDPRSEARIPLRWCEYHNLEGHNTIDCFMLKGQIRRLIGAKRPQAAKGKKFEEVDSGEGGETVEARTQSLEVLRFAATYRWRAGEQSGRQHRYRCIQVHLGAHI
ncbi:uncharacterized protein LOC130736615 [Lotus japonicus]|uniref:uncharacterized protein LOC130736615 n=1 Tax=Lotus japonicus TaxID=34305 RepID=UPI00258FF57C|nr:uncharacterized protein LOC130736615 [Lotus japonicus]